MLNLVRNKLAGNTADFTFTRFHLPDRIFLNNDTGLYLHIPFCRNSCPYCPYVKTIYKKDLAAEYGKALKNEITLYHDYFGDAKFTSLYIGGGTPTLMIDGLREIMDHLNRHFTITGDIAMETSPDEISPGMVQKARSMGVNMLSLGVQSFHDGCLQKIGRVYDGRSAETALKELAGAGFDTVNVDLIFAIDGQGVEEIRQDLAVVIDAGIDQVTCYPLFTFPYTEIGRARKLRKIKLPGIISRRKMYYAITDFLTENGYSRTNVWSFSKNPSQNYSSVTRDHFLGLGAGSGSYNGKMFYFNTFSIPEYIKTASTKLPVSIKMDVGVQLEKLIWLYWQLYDTTIDRGRYRDKFGTTLEDDFPRVLKTINMLGFIEGEDDNVMRLNTRGAHWIHLIQNYFALDYVTKIWASSKSNAWPEKIKL